MKKNAAFPLSLSLSVVISPTGDKQEDEEFP